MPSPTIVSCLFDLARREPALARATVEQYLVWGELLLGLDADLVVFADPEVATAISDGRRRHGLGHRTRTVPIDLEELESVRAGEVERIRSRRPLLNADPSKDTPLYTCLGWAKFEMLDRAIALDPFGSDTFTWCDFGIAHVALITHHADDGVFTQAATDRVRMLQLRPLDPTLLSDRAHHLSYRWGHFAAGLISGARAPLGELIQAITEARDGALREGFAPLDEQLLDLVVAAHPELFSCHHGDYDHIIENYRRPRGSAANLAFQLKIWRARSDWHPAGLLAAQIIEAIEDGEFVSDSGELAVLLEECFIALYYAEPEDRSRARAAAELYAEHARSDADFRDTFLLSEIRIRANLVYVGVSV